MLVVSKNRRAQVVYQRVATGDGAPDISLERHLVLAPESLAVSAEQLEVSKEGSPVCTVEGDLTVSSNQEVVLFLVCDKED